MRSNIYTTKKEVEMVDSMISWAKKQTILSSIYQIPKARYDSRKYTGLTFDDVSNSISSSNIEGIFRDYIHLINPDSDIERKARSIKAGSLEMNLENGLWHRFSTNQGGNIFGFVREATGVSKRESLEIVASYGYIGRQIPKTSIVSSRDSYNLLKKPKDLWAVYKPLPINAPEFEPNKHISFLLKENNLDSIHSYRDKNGYIIGHTIRLINKENSSKQVMPISYCHNSFLKKSEWRLKAFADDNGNKPIYGMEKLYRDKVTLIVEGEKTADKAEILLPDYNVISWLGGAGNADKVDWSILKDREVVIWPDNDLAGFIAAKTIINRLNSITHSIDKVSIVDIESLNLPQKWDLADEMPSGITIDMIKESIVNSMQNANSLTYIRILADNSSDEVEKRIIWQNRNSGFVLSTKEIEKELFEENRLYNKICSKDAIFYVKYANNKGISSSAHEFLDIEHDLYRESLIAIAKYHGSKINLEQNIPDFLDELQIIYMQKKDNFTGHLDYIKNGSELYNILLRDILLLHQMQMSSNVNVKLSDLHKEMVVQNISKIIYDYSSSSDKLEDQDRIKIADAVYNKCCDSNWWKDLIEARFEIRNQPQDFDIQKFCKHHIENNISRKNNVFHVQQNNIKFIEEKNTLDHNIARVEKTVQLYKAKSLTKDM